MGSSETLKTRFLKEPAGPVYPMCPRERGRKELLMALFVATMNLVAAAVTVFLPQYGALAWLLTAGITFLALVGGA